MRALRSAAFLSVTLVALATAGSATADVEIGALPGGTSISVAINTPADEAVVQLGDPVPVSGTAAVATSVILKDTTVVYVVDRSGSMSLSAGVDCNGIAGADTRLVCVQEAIGVANAAAAAASSSVDLTGLGSLPAPMIRTASPTMSTLAPQERSSSSRPLSTGTATRHPTSRTWRTGSWRRRHVLLVRPRGGDRHPDEPREHERGQHRHLPLRRLQRRRRERLDGDRLPGRHDHPRFALGDPAVVNCSAPAAAGNLDAVAALTPGGTCQQTEDFADVGDVISEAIGSTLSAVTLTVDAVPQPIVVVPALRCREPAAVAFSTTLLGLSARPHTLVARATGSDAGGARQHLGHTIFVNTPPSCAGATAGGQIWPPNHKFVARSITGVTDADGDPVTVTITGITQDEASQRCRRRQHVARRRDRQRRLVPGARSEPAQATAACIASPSRAPTTPAASAAASSGSVSRTISRERRRSTPGASSSRRSDPLGRL